MKLRYSKTARGLVLTLPRRLRERVIAVVAATPDLADLTLGALKQIAKGRDGT